MFRRPLSLVVRVCAVLAFVALFAGPAFGQRSAVPPKAQVEEVLQKVMQLEIETRDFEAPVSLKDAIALISEKLAVRQLDALTGIYVRNDLFRAFAPDSVSILDAQVRCQPIPRKKTLARVLREILGDVQPLSTFVLRRGGIEIVPVQAATTALMLEERFTAVYHDAPAKSVFSAIVDESGVGLAIDSEAEKLLSGKVSLLLPNATCGEALRCVCELTGTRAVIMSTVVIITTPERAEQMQKRNPPPPAPPAMIGA